MRPQPKKGEWVLSCAHGRKGQLVHWVAVTGVTIRNDDTGEAIRIDYVQVCSDCFGRYHGAIVANAPLTAAFQLERDVRVEMPS